MTYRFVKFHTGPSGRTRAGRVEKKKASETRASVWSGSATCIWSWARELSGSGNDVPATFQVSLPYVRCTSPKGSREPLMIPAPQPPQRSPASSSELHHLARGKCRASFRGARRSLSPGSP